MLDGSAAQMLSTKEDILTSDPLRVDEYLFRSEQARQVTPEGVQLLFLLSLLRFGLRLRLMHSIAQNTLPSLATVFWKPPITVAMCKKMLMHDLKEQLRERALSVAGKREELRGRLMLSVAGGNSHDAVVMQDDSDEEDTSEGDEEKDEEADGKENDDVGELTEDACRKMLIPELKRELGRRNLSVRGKRLELRERLVLAIAVQQEEAGLQEQSNEDCADETEPDVAEHLTQDMCAVMLVGDLKTELAARGLSCVGIRSVLRVRLSEHVASRLRMEGLQTSKKEEDLEAGKNSGAVPKSVNRQAAVLLRGLNDSTARLCKTLMNHASKYPPLGSWSGMQSWLALLSTLPPLLENCDKLEAVLSSFSIAMLAQWISEYMQLLDFTIAAVSVLAQDSSMLRHKTNQIDCTDAGNGVGVQYQSVTLLLVAFVIIAQCRTYKRVHNACHGSYVQVSEQSVGAVYSHTDSSTPMDELDGFHGFQKLGPDEVATFDFSVYPEETRRQAMKSAFDKAWLFRNMVNKKKYDRSLISAEVWQDPAVPMNAEYPPLFDVAWFTELYEHATAASSSQASINSNPLSPWTKMLANFNRQHSKKVGKNIAYELRTSMCDHVGADVEACDFESHIRQEFGHGDEIPPHTYPVKRCFDDGVFHYERSGAQAFAVDALLQVVIVPAEQLTTMLQGNLHEWFMQCFKTIQTGPAVRYEWKLEFSPWVNEQIQTFLHKCGPTREVVLAAICKYLLLKSTVISVQRTVVTLIRTAVMPELTRWHEELGETVEALSELLHNGEVTITEADSDLPLNLGLWVKTKLLVIGQQCQTKPRSVLLVVLDVLQAKPMHGEKKARKRDDQVEKDAAPEEDIVSFEEAYTRPARFWQAFAQAHPSVADETSVPHTKMEAASWAATQHFSLLDVDGFDIFGSDFFESEEIKQNLQKEDAKLDVSLIRLQTVVAFIGLDWKSFYLGRCVRLQPNMMTDHIQIHYYGLASVGSVHNCLVWRSSF